MLLDIGEHGVEIGGSVALDEITRRLGRGGLAEEAHHLYAFPQRELDRAGERGAGIESSTCLAGEARSRGKGCRGGGTAASAQELGTVGRPGRLAAAQVGEGDAAGKRRAPRVTHQHRAGPFIDLGDEVGGRGAARRAQDPFRVGGYRQVAGTA